MDVESSSTIEVKIVYKGRSVKTDVPKAVTLTDLQNAVRELFSDLAGDSDRTTMNMKLIYKGKVLGHDHEGKSPTDAVLPKGIRSKPMPKIVVMASSSEAVSILNAKRSDPLMRGFDHEQQRPVASETRYWGPKTGQHRDYKFVRIKACTWQSFGHRPNSKTPHAFEALRMLERLSTDPGVVAVMTERELVVNTLGEMDPIDDRLMQKQEAHGGCLLGYNTNRGLRIDLKLRPDTLEGFYPYESIAATLIHELSHNWVGDHNALFWSNYGQMRVEYLHRHAVLAASGYLVDGRTTASIAGVSEHCKGGLVAISKNVQQEVSREMLQHGVPLAAVAPAIIKRCEELEAEGVAKDTEGHRLGGGDDDGDVDNTVPGSESRTNTRHLALAAAERRAEETKLRDHNCGKEEGHK